MIINITGHKGSGKSTVLDYFKHLGFNSFEIYDSYHSLLKNKVLLPEEIVPKNLWDDSYVRVVHKYILEQFDEEIVFLGGLLRTEELDFLKRKTQVISVVIEVDEERKRYDRLRERGRDKEANYTDEDFKLRDAHRRGLVDGYRENKLDEIIKSAEFTVKNNEDMKTFESKLFELGCKIGGKLQESDFWHNSPTRYANHNNYSLFNLEALLSGRKMILNNLGIFESVLVLGCSDGRDLNLINARYKIGVDKSQEAILEAKSKNDREFISGDLFDVDGEYDLVTMLRVIGGIDIDTETAINKALDLSRNSAVISIATAGILPQGMIKKYNHALNGQIKMEDYLKQCKQIITSRRKIIQEIDTPFERYFLC